MIQEPRLYRHKASFKAMQWKEGDSEQTQSILNWIAEEANCRVVYYPARTCDAARILISAKSATSMSQVLTVKPGDYIVVTRHPEYRQISAIAAKIFLDYFEEIEDESVSSIIRPW